MSIVLASHEARLPRGSGTREGCIHLFSCSPEGRARSGPELRLETNLGCHVLEEIVSLLMGQEGLPGFGFFGLLICIPILKTCILKTCRKGRVVLGWLPLLLLSALHSLFSSILARGASASGKAAPVKSSDLKGQWGPSHSPSWRGGAAA